MKLFTVTVLTMVMSTAAVAGPVPQGTWSTKEGCDRLDAMAKDSDAAWQGEFETISYLTKNGVQGYEWGCTFLQSSSDAYGNTVHVSSCSAEGDAWPELLMVAESNSQGWTVTTAPQGKDDKMVKLEFPVQCAEQVK